MQPARAAAHTKNTVILSEDRASLCEVRPQSKNPYSVPPKESRGDSRPSLLRREPKGLSAKRSSRTAASNDKSAVEEEASALRQPRPPNLCHSEKRSDEESAVSAASREQSAASTRNDNFSLPGAFPLPLQPLVILRRRSRSRRERLPTKDLCNPHLHRCRWIPRSFGPQITRPPG